MPGRGGGAPPYLGIVADDLTGAMDTAGPLAGRGLSTLVALGIEGLDGGRHDVLCYNTQTRNASSGDARQAVRMATRRLVRRGVRRLYKKIDSTLRGQVGPEVLAMLEESGTPSAFVAPAFPALGRSVRDGVLYVGGVPLERSDEGNDPLSVPESSSVVELLERQTGRRAGLVSLADVERGDEAIERRVGILLADGCSLVVFDAVDQDQMRSIEELLAHEHPDGLLVGSGGLATAIADRIAAEPGAGVPALPPVQPGVNLVISGSLNPATAGQLDRLAQGLGTRRVAMRAAEVLASDATGAAELGRIAHEVAAAIGTGDDVALEWVRPGPTGPTPHSDGMSERSRRLNPALEALAPRLLRSGPVSGLVLVGGDTAHSVLAGLGAGGVALYGELLPGVPIGRVVGGDADGVTLVTKAGGFGAEDALVEVIERLRALSGASR